MFLFNISNKDKGKYLEYIKAYKKRTGNSDIYIDNNAYSDGRKLDDHCAIRSSSGNYENINTFYDVKSAIRYIENFTKELKVGEYKDVRMIDDSVCKILQENGFKTEDYDFGFQMTRVTRIR